MHQNLLGAVDLLNPIDVGPTGLSREVKNMGDQFGPGLDLHFFFSRPVSAYSTSFLHARLLKTSLVASNVPSPNSGRSHMTSKAPEHDSNPNHLNCPVCLQPFEDQVTLNQCFHAFCRFCILQWSEFEPAQRHGRNRCPLCRVHFTALYSHFDPDSQTYDTQLVEETKETHHWSNFYENKSAIEVQRWRSKTDSVLRKRRLTVYESHLYPLIDFKLPLMSSYKSLEALSKRFSTKASIFLSRELPFLLLHDHMKKGISSLAKQEKEVSLILDLVKAMISPAIVPLALLVSARVSCTQSSDWEIFDSLELTNDQKDAFEELDDALAQFFGWRTIILLRELALFTLSPYSLKEFDDQVKYQESIESEVSFEDLESSGEQQTSSGISPQ